MKTDSLDLPPAHGARGSVRLPGSKSISNRVLLLAALARGVTEIEALLASDDTQVMLEALGQLGVPCIRHPGTDNYRVEGAGGPFPVKRAELFLGNAGTAFRSLTAACALAGGHYTLRGVPRMHERPIGDLVDALRQLGAQIHFLGKPGFPPLEIAPPERPGGADRGAEPLTVTVKGNVSSQYLTGLLLSAPLLGRPVSVQVDGELISKPYVEITLNLMHRFGVDVERQDWAAFTVPMATYRSPGRIRVEGDASSASYFLAAGAIGGGPVRVVGAGRGSIQGDIRFAEALAAMGARIAMGDDWIEASAPEAGRLMALDMDCNHIPDAAMTLAVAALFAQGTTTLRNIASWRVKETDRIAAMATELRKVGATVQEGADYIRITPPLPSPPGSGSGLALTPHAEIDTYDDHRMAMCFSLICLGGVPIRINDPKCVNKTFPDYWATFAAIVQP